MRYQEIATRECLNDGPVFPMMLTIHPVYKMLSRLTSPLVGLETFTRTYLRILTRDLK